MVTFYALHLVVKSETREDFFARGKQFAALLDEKKSLPSQRTISFEDPLDLVKFLTEWNLALVAAVRKHAYSVSDLAKVLKSSRAAINKDLHLLESVGIIETHYVPNPGHGKYKMVSAVDKHPIKLQVYATL